MAGFPYISRMEKIPVTCRLSFDAALFLVNIAHDKFGDSLGKAVEWLISETKARATCSCPRKKDSPAHI